MKNIKDRVAKLHIESKILDLKMELRYYKFKKSKYRRLIFPLAWIILEGIHNDKEDKNENKYI